MSGTVPLNLSGNRKAEVILPELYGTEVHTEVPGEIFPVRGVLSELSELKV